MALFSNSNSNGRNNSETSNLSLGNLTNKGKTSEVSTNEYAPNPNGYEVLKTQTIKELIAPSRC